ncbi:MAG: hypothetical protein Tsb0032_12740 [Kiloniellaceae bacterium]
MSNIGARDSGLLQANRATYTAPPAALSTPDCPDSLKKCPRNPALSLSVRGKAGGETALPIRKVT